MEYSSFGWVTPYISVARTRASAGAGSVDASTASNGFEVAGDAGEPHETIISLEQFRLQGWRNSTFLYSISINQCKSAVFAGMTLQNSNFVDEFTVLYSTLQYVVCIFCQG